MSNWNKASDLYTTNKKKKKKKKINKLKLYTVHINSNQVTKSYDETNGKLNCYSEDCKQPLLQKYFSTLFFYQRTISNK